MLTEGDDQQDPIADAARAILDGHIVLSRELAEAGHYPGDRHRSLDQPRHDQPDHCREHFEQVRGVQAALFALPAQTRPDQRRRLRAGSDPLLDQAIALHPRLEAFLQQGIFERAEHAESAARLSALLAQQNS